MQALDLSFSAPLVTQSWAEARIAEGYELLVVDLWTGNQRIPSAEQALRVWREAGGIPAAYFVVHNYQGVGASYHFAQARSAAGREWGGLAFVAVDVEVDPTSPATVKAGCDMVTQNGQRPMVYTRESIWRDLCDNTTLLRHVPLWDARYRQSPTLDLVDPYGGWTERTGHQHTNTTRLFGLDVCIDLFDPEWVRAGAPPSIDLDRVERALGGLWGIGNALHPLATPRRDEQHAYVQAVKDEFNKLLRAVGMPELP